MREEFLGCRVDEEEDLLMEAMVEKYSSHTKLGYKIILV